MRNEASDPEKLEENVRGWNSNDILPQDGKGKERKKEIPYFYLILAQKFLAATLKFNLPKKKLIRNWAAELKPINQNATAIRAALISIESLKFLVSKAKTGDVANTEWAGSNFRQLFFALLWKAFSSDHK